MKKCLISLVLIMCAFHPINAQQLVWAKQFTGPGSGGFGNTNVGSDGYVYTVGGFSGTVDFDPGPGIHNMTSAGRDFAISKFSNSGELVWAKQIECYGGTNPYHVMADDSGNVVVTGIFEDSADFDPGPGTYLLHSKNTREDIFILKLNSSGDFVWAKSISTTSADFCRSSAVDANGNVYTTGCVEGGNYPYGTDDFDPGPGTFYLGGFQYMFIQKLDAGGNFVWVKQFGGQLYSTFLAGDVRGYSIVVDDIGFVYATGFFTSSNYGPIDFDPGPGTYDLHGGQSVFTLKLDTAGSFIWVKQIETWGDNNSGYGITVDKEYNVYTTGYFTDSADFDPGPSVYPMLSRNGGSIGKSVFIQKLDSAGDFVWAKQLRGSAESYCVKTDNSKNVYVYGDYIGIIDVNPGPDTMYLATDINGSKFIVKLDSIGNLAWAGSLDEGGYMGSFGLDSTGNLYIASALYDPIDVDISSGQHVFTSTGAADGYLIKIASCTSSFQISGQAASPSSCPGSDGVISFSGVDSTLSYSIFYKKNGMQMPSTIITDAVMSNLSFGVYDSITASIGGCQSNTIGPLTLTAECDSVWPGDLNYDMIANNNDVLDLLLVYGETGVTRTNASTTWIPQYCDDWNSTQYNTINTKHADCNGDGVVNYDDTLTVSLNYGLTHLRGTHEQQPIVPGYPDLYFDLEGIQVRAGIPVDIPVKLGSPNLPVNDIIGMAAQFKVEGVTLDETPIINATISWIGEGNRTLLFTKAIDNNRVDWAFGRTDHTNVSGDGLIGYIRLMLPADEAGKEITMYFDDVRIIDNKGNALSGINVLDATVKLARMDAVFTIYPNPTTKTTNIASQETIDKIIVTDVLGKKIYESSPNRNTATIDLQTAGMYFVTIIANGKTSTQKLVAGE